MTAQGLEVLFDDREERPGVKFKDADLIGLPLRLTVSTRSLDHGGAELKLRTSQEKHIVPLNQVIPRLQREIEEMEMAIQTMLQEPLPQGL